MTRKHVFVIFVLLAFIFILILSFLKIPQTLLEKARNWTADTHTIVCLFGPSIPIGYVTGDLADTKPRKSLKMQLELELSSAEPLLKSEIEKHMPQIRAVIIATLSTMTSDQVLAQDGKTLLREEITSRINSGILKTGKIRNIYFTDFDIQP